MSPVEWDESTSMEQKHYVFGSTTLIQLVHERRCLWDPSIANYKNKVENKKAWKEIYCLIEPNFESLTDADQEALGHQIMKKWCNIRDSYVKWLKNDKRTKPYVYHQYLTFLNRVYQDNPSRSKRRHEESSSEHYVESTEFEMACADSYLDDQVMDDADENVLGSVPDEPSLNVSYDTEALSSPSISTINLRRENVKIDNLNKVLLKVLKKQEDEDEAFFSSVIPSVKKMNDKTKLQFRMEVLKLIKRLKTSKKKQKTVKVEVESSDEIGDDE